jgi:hypothetical protein
VAELAGCKLLLVLTGLRGLRSERSAGVDVLGAAAAVPLLGADSTLGVLEAGAAAACGMALRTASSSCTRTQPLGGPDHKGPEHMQRCACAGTAAFAYQLLGSSQAPG